MSRLADVFSSDHIATAADVATVLAAVGALIAAVIALRQLRSQTEGQVLGAILATNDLWRDVVAAQSEVTLHAKTVDRIIAIYSELGASSTLDGAGGKPLKAKAPYVLGALFPTGFRNATHAPCSLSEYNQCLLNRTVAFGYVLNHLRVPRTADDEVPGKCVSDADAIQAAMEKWVNKLNEVAELYGHGLVNRRLFIGKRHITIAQQAFFAEPYILWRNSIYSGRWGLRILSLGEEARRFHWYDDLQTDPVMARTDPDGHETTDHYAGFRFRVGWMFGSTRHDRRLLRWKRDALGSAFTDENRAAIGRLARAVPTDPRIVTDADPATKTWEHVTPQEVRDAAASLHRTPGVHDAAGTPTGPTTST